MALDILSEPSKSGGDDGIVEQMRSAILAAIPDGRIEVRSVSPRHFEIDAVSPAFEGKSRVQQQQLVYAAIAPLMAGDRAPVHAIDRLTTHSE